MKLRAGFIPAILAILAVCVPSWAQPIDGPELFRDLQDELALSDAQITEIEEIHWEARAEEIEKRAQLELAELEFQKIMAQDDPEDKDVMNAFERVGIARMELEKIHIRRRLEVNRILTKEQKFEMRRHMKERKPRPRPVPRPGE